MQYSETYSRDFFSIMKSKIDGSISLLDVGSGLCLKSDQYDCKTIIALEIHRPYLENRKCTGSHIIPVNENAMNIGKLFMPKSISSILLNDVIEHFSKDDGLKLLQMAEQIANKCVVVFTPRGFFPQRDYDYFQLQGEQFQEHRSGWEPEEFMSMGYNVMVFKKFHDERNLSFLQAFGSNHPPVDAILAWKGCE